jgi:hypothetical protein
MQTTLTIDDDVLAEAEELASRRNQTVGQVISSLSREGLKSAAPQPVGRSGFPLLPMRDPTPVTLEFVNQLRDELPR